MEDLEIKLIVDNKEFECTLDPDSKIYSKDKISIISDFVEYSEEEAWMENEYWTDIYKLINENKNITIKLK